MRNTENRSLRRSGRARALRGMAALAAALLAGGIFLTAAFAAAETGSEADEGLVITVLEDIRAEDVDDGGVPLSLLSPSQHSRIRHAALMGAALTAVIAYVWYFGSFEKKLRLLRRTAAREEHRVMSAGRTEAGTRE